MKTLRYRTPAKKWIDAMPLGNGITGAMVYGGKDTERIAFNNASLWSGYPKNHDNENSLKYLNEARALVFSGKNAEADFLTEKFLDGDYSEGYLPFGYLDIDFKDIKTKKYLRQLDIEKGVLQIGTKGLLREAFISYPDRVMLYTARADRSFNAQIKASSKLKHEVMYTGDIILTVKAPDHVVPKYMGKVKNAVQYTDMLGMSASLVARVISDGTVKKTATCLEIENATYFTLIIATETGFIGFDKMPLTENAPLIKKCFDTIESAITNLDKLKERHVEDFSTLFNKQSLSLYANENAFTDTLYRKAKLGIIKEDLVSLFYNYGKYLTIAGSRKGGQALNLQGIWNDDIRPPWSSNYTTNINAEMNYWPTSQVALEECLIPYLDMVYELSERGKSTARVNYGAKGFSVNHNTDIWRKTAPVKGNPQYMYAPLCGAWLTNEVCEHYFYGNIPQYKDKIIEIVKENVAFILDYLVEHDGYLVTCPSASPENFFKKDGKHCYLDFASNFEMGIIKESLNNFIKLLPDDENVDTVKATLAKLYPFKEGKDGLLEWSAYYETPEVGHRHFSPLYAFHPGRTIGYYLHPEEREWVRKLMHVRIFNVKQYFGWSGAWALAIAARLREKENVSLVIKRVLGKAIFKNLFDMHPPRLFQIDGNFGFVHGINEALMQIEDDTLELLPALPSFLPNGEIKGARLRGGYEIDFSWQNGTVTSLTVSGGELKLRNRNLNPSITLNGAKIIY